MLKIQQGLFIAVLLIVTLTSIPACDSSDNIPVKVVTDETLLSDSELEKLSPHIKADGVTDDQQKIIFFGFDLRASPQEDAAQYLPFLRYLENATGYRFKLHFTPENSSTVEELGKNKIQLAAMGAGSFIEAEIKYGAVSLVRGLNLQDKAEYQSVFVSRSDSNINTIADILGKRVAFGSYSSTQGHIIPRIMLDENGITLKDLKSYEYTGSHQNCAEAVISKKYDVCGMQDQLANSLEAKGLVKIIKRSAYYPSSGIVAAKTLDKKICQKIKKALLDFKPTGKDKQGLYHWQKTEMPLGFTEAKANDYAKLKKWLIKLGFLKTETKAQ